MKTRGFNVDDVKDTVDVSMYLANRYSQLGYHTLVDWIKEMRLPLPHESASRVLLRKQKCGIEIFLKLAICLDISNEDMIKILKRAYDDDIIWRRLQAIKLTMKDQLILSKFNSLDDEKQEHIIKMIDMMK